MSLIKNIWNKVKGSESVLYPTFQIKASNVIGGIESRPVKARKNYFEISLTEQFLKNGREYWNQYIPLTVFLTEFIYANKRSAFPFVIGPELLKSIEQLDGTESVRYKNTRVVGPTPYRGDNIVIFSGLFRVKTKNWAAQTISLLETVAKAFDTTKLSSYLNIADPLLNGIEGFFGMGKDMQFRIGQRNEFKDSEIHSSNVFVSGYWLMVREDQKNVDKNKFWVKDNELYYGTTKSNIKPYRGNDFILYEINDSEKRNDYETFDFHLHWENARDAVITKNSKQAESEFQMLMVGLYQNQDIIESQKNQLLMMYSGMFEKIKETFLNKSSISEIASSLKSNRELLKSSGISIELSSKAVELTTKFANKTSSLFEKNNFVIDQDFIERSLDNSILNEPDVLDIDNFDLISINPKIEFFETK